MSPSRGDQGQGRDCDDLDDDEEIKTARLALRKILSSLHVLEALPERSRILAVDAELPVNTVISAVFAEQHPLPRPFTWCPKPPGQKNEGGTAGNVESTPDAKADDAPPISCGVVSPALPSNVLAEVCELDSREPTKQDKDVVVPEEKAPIRRWTSPDDGWGTSAPPMQDMEKMMPMGMPLTVREMADFLMEACRTKPGEDTAKIRERWAERVQPEAPSEKAAQPKLEDMLDWSLVQWRRLKMVADKGAEDKQSKTTESVARITEEQFRSTGTVLVHQVPSAPPRPILCTDDPDANLLKAVELLLAYPDLDAVPVVSQGRCTVVAHLTLSYCLSFMLHRLRGANLKPLADMEVGHGVAKGADPPQRRFDTTAAELLAKQAAEGQWAERKIPLVKGTSGIPWVLDKRQTLSDLLLFFSATSMTSIPIVEEDPADRTPTPGVVGVISRRDLVQYIGLAVQSAQRHTEFKDCQIERIPLSLDTTLEAVLEVVKKYRVPIDDEVPPPYMDQASAGLGVSMIYEEDITMKALLLRVLVAENRKVLFVKDRGFGDPPQLLRFMSLSDIWLLLIGTEQDCKAPPQDSKSATTEAKSEEEPLSATDV